MRKEIMSATAAAKILGCSPEAVRQRIRLGIWKFGECIPKERTGRKQDNFIIYRRKLEKHLGIEKEKQRNGT